MAPSYANTHLSTERLANGFASVVMSQDRKAEVLTAIGDPDGARDLIVALSIYAEDAFDVGGIMEDDAYMNATLDALKNALTR